MPAAILHDARDVNPHRPYPAAAVAGLLSVSVDTVRRWVRTRRLAACPRPNPRSPLRVMGVDVLLLLGVAAPEPSETKAERMRRVAADYAEIDRLAKGRTN